MQSDQPGRNWRPVAEIRTLQQRADLLTAIRQFMATRAILEVETPILSQAAVSDPALESFQVETQAATMYLQTSPEFSMKRLLAAGSGPIYQLARVFRDDERSRLHQPEFTLLEWYRPGFGVNDMLAEIDMLLLELGLPAAKRLSYAELFEQHLHCNPHTASHEQLQTLASQHGLYGTGYSQSALLDFLFSHCLIPALTDQGSVIITDFPALQAALARLRCVEQAGHPSVAERFELFVHGIEIGNGFHELTDAVEQRQRFLRDQATRQSAQQKQRPLDEHLLAALVHGMPASCGMAIGVDRLLMALHGIDHIDHAVAFPVERA
ncbi:MAG: EF-P lysine aminoacylase EpmA [Gammaproteobacteria bacterium]